MFEPADQSGKTNAVRDCTADLKEDDSPRDVFRNLLRAGIEITNSKKGAVYLYRSKKNGMSLEMLDSAPAESPRADKNGGSPQAADSPFNSTLSITLEDANTVWGVLYLQGKVTDQPYSTEDYANLSFLAADAVERLNQIEFRQQKSLFNKDSERLRKECDRLRLHKASLEKSLPILTVLIDGQYRVIDACERYKEVFNKDDSVLFEDLFAQPLWSYLADPAREKLKEAVRNNVVFIAEDLLRITTPESNLLFKVRMLPLPRKEVGDSLRIYMIILEDISQYEKIKRRLSQLTNLSMIVEILAGIAHDLNNPLDALNRLIQVLEIRVGDQVDSEVFDMMYSAIDRMSNTIRSVLESTRAAMIKNTSIPLGQLLDESLYIMSPQLADKNIRVEKRYESPHIKSNFTSNLYNVFINLIKNAYDAMALNGDLEILVTDDPRDPERVRVVLRDDGCGIPEEIIEDVTKPFFTTKEKGTGLGLFLCKKIVTDLGGEIVLRNRKHRGCEVAITLKL